MLNVLIVDDSKFQTAALSKRIAALGHQVECCQSVAEAMQFLQEHSPSIIFTDLMMPDVNGIELIKYIRTKGLQTKIVVVTADPQDKIREDLNQFNVVDIVAKPISKQDLLSSLSL